MTQKSFLFTPLKIKSIEFKNRIWVSPMCQYSSVNGHPTDWHFVHLGSRAVGGAGHIMVEATAVTPEGRISPDDSGIWSDDHIAGFKKINDFLKSYDVVCGVQLAHAGRKGSTSAPWLGNKVLDESQRGWKTLTPSAVPFEADDPAPHEMSREEIKGTIRAFEEAAVRSLEAGFQVVELHFAHGYLAHQFLSPISNLRTDEYGGSLENRMRFALEIAKAVRNKWPADLPLFARISATDWAGGADELKDINSGGSIEADSWNLAQSIILCRDLKAIGIDLIDCSTGGTLPTAQIPVGPGYQVPFAEKIRKETGMMTAAVGMITDPNQAEAIIAEQKADAIFMAREFLRNPYWPAHAAKSFGIKIKQPVQYGRA